MIGKKSAPNEELDPPPLWRAPLVPTMVLTQSAGCHAVHDAVCALPLPVPTYAVCMRTRVVLVF